METFKLSSLSSTSVFDFSYELGKYKDYTDPVCFCFPASTFYEPFGMLLASASIRQFRKNNPCSRKSYSFDQNNDACRYAGHMGFFKSISNKINYGKSPGEARGSRSYVPITRIDLDIIRQRALREHVVVQQQIQATAEKLAGVLAHDNTSLKSTLTYVFREIVRNVEEHSHSSAVWICAQHWPHYKLVEISFLDEGIGIKRSLKTNRYFSRSINTDYDALKFSILPGISEAYKRREVDEGPWVNSGYGLYIAKEICAALNGMFLLCSGSSCIGLRNTGKHLETIEEKASLAGTAVCMRFHTHEVENFERIRNDIISRGHAEAKTISNAIRKASYSSGALIDLIK